MRLRLTVPHVYGCDPTLRLPSGSLRTAADWDALRLAGRSTDFGLGESRAEWVACAAARTDLRRCAHLVSELLAAWGAGSAVSVGAGTGMLEYHLAHAAPALRLRCGDFAPQALDRLRDRLSGLAEVERVDFHTADWVRSPDEPVIMHRVDTELSDGEWRLAFERLRRSRVERIAWIPCGLVTVAAMTAEVRSLVAAVLRKRRLVRAGYLRSEARMLDLFAASYRRTAVRPGGELPVWTLERRPSEG